MKRTKKLDFDSPSKISIQPDVGMITKKDHLFSEGLIQFLLINVIALCSIITGLSYIDMPTSVFLLMCESLLISTLLCFSGSKITKAGTITACILLFIWLKNAVVKGAFLLVDQYAQLLDMPFEAPFEPDTVLSDETTVTLFLSAYMLLMVLVLYFSVFLTKNFIFTFAVSFIMPEIGLYNGDVPNYISAFMLVAAWVCVFAMQLNDYHANRAGKKNVFTRQKRKNVFYMTQRGMKNSAFGQLSVQLCIFMAAALLLAVAGSSFAGYKRSDRINTMRKDLTYDFSVKTIVNTLRELSGIQLPTIKSSIDLLGSAAISGGMAKGDLSNVNNIRFSGKKLMEITFDSLPSGTTYLRGFAAGNYSGSRWRNAAVNRNENDFDALQIMGSINTAMESSSTFNKYYNRLQIKDLTKSGILFAPYFSSFEGLKNVNNVSYDYMTTKNDFYTMDYIRFNESPEQLYESSSYIDGYSDPNITAYFLVLYHLQRSDNPDISPEEVLEGLPVNNILKMPGIENEFMAELIDGMNVYLNYGEEQASLLAFIGERTEGDTIDERYTINLNYIDEYGLSLQNELITFDDLVYMAYDAFIANNDIDSLADDVKYMNYVFENYTNVDIELNENVINALNEELEGYPYDSILSGNNSFISDYTNVSNIVIHTIKEYFNEHYSYSLQNPKTPSGRDFIEYFLSEMNTGSCTYFSSAAAELLRHYGIPARYAEGFMIPLDQFRSNAQKNSETGQYSMDVLDNYAHAWVEIYMPGLGWLPVDFTLGVQQATQEAVTSQSGEQTSATTTTTVTTTVTTEKTTTVTTAPQVNESETNSTTGSGGSTVKKAGNSKLSGILMTVGAAVLIVAMFVLAYLACINVIKRGLKDSINEENENRRAVNIYDIVLMYLACIGIRCSENISDKDRCEKLCVMLAEADITGLSEAMRAACGLAVEAGMSGGMITPEENEQMIALLKKVRDVCYEKMTGPQRFTAKYIKGLY